MPSVSISLRVFVTVVLALGLAAARAEETQPKKPLGPGASPEALKSKAPASAPSAKRIHLSPMTPLASTVNVHEKTLDECRIQTLLPQSIAERSPDVELTDAPGAMKLELKIVDVRAPSGGWFSGPKWITVDGRLLQGKTVKGDFVAKETSMASASNCGMLSKVILVMAGDIAAWLQNPAKGSRLGGAR